MLLLVETRLRASSWVGRLASLAATEEESRRVPVASSAPPPQAVKTMDAPASSNGRMIFKEDSVLLLDRSKHRLSETIARRMD